MKSKQITINHLEKAIQLFLEEHNAKIGFKLYFPHDFDERELLLKLIKNHNMRVVLTIEEK